MTPEQFKAVRRGKLKLSQEGVGAAVGRHRTAVQRYEAGLDPIPHEIALAMAWLAAFGASDPWAPDWRPHQGATSDGNRPTTAGATSDRW